MSSPPSVLIDLNVVLDVLQRREPHFRDSAVVLAYAETGRIAASLAAHSWTTLFYLYRRAHSTQEAHSRITELIQFLNVAAVDQRVVEQALNLAYTDFEDAVQMMAAANARMDYLVTRNLRNYKSGPLPVLQPGELIGVLGEDQ